MLNSNNNPKKSTHNCNIYFLVNMLNYTVQYIDLTLSKVLIYKRVMPAILQTCLACHTG